MRPSPRSVRWVVLPLALVGGVAAAQGVAEPHYWKQRQFFIPYQPNPQDPQAGKVDKVQLLLSRDGGLQWAVLQEAEPHVRGFSYHAATDGDYAFALRMADRRGKYWPEQIAQPLLRVVVDSAPPMLELSASLDATGQIVVRYEARDAKLKPETLRLEVQSDGGVWQRLGTGPPDVSQPDRLLGQLAWRPPTSGGRASFRASVDDAAGNSATTNAEASLISPVLDPATGPQLAPPSLTGWSPSGQVAALAEPQRQALEWPVGGAINSLASNRREAPSGGAGATDPFASRVDGADRGAPSLLTPGASTPAPPISNGGWVSSAPAAVANGVAEPPDHVDPTPWVNSLTFDVDYDIQTVGPWGVSKVELWGTRDGGNEWLSLGVDSDNRSPMRVTVPAQGVYGFRIAVDGGNGVTASKPQSGDRPEMSVGVDLAPPRAELRAAEPGQGSLTGHVIIRWSAEDEHLAARPAGLFSSASAEGPWTTIATDLDNTGEYVWRLGRDAPPRVFLRLEVRDAAGNVAVQQTREAVDLNLPRPTGRLRNVRPVQDEPERFRTAAGARSADR